MDKKKYLMLGTAIVSLSGLASQHEAVAATGVGNMDAVIAAAITVQSVQRLDFSTLTGTAGGAYTVSTGGAGSGAVTSIGGTAQAGILKISGQANASVQISAAAPTYTVNDVGAGAPMNVNAFLFGGGAGAATLITNIGAGGNVNVPVGATLTVGAGQVAGSYTGDYTVNVNYN